MTYMRDLYQRLRRVPVTQAVLIATILVSGTLLFGGIAHAATNTSKVATTNSSATSGGSATSGAAKAAQHARIQNIITKGNEEIDRRLVTLNTLTAEITAATHLTAGDESTLSAEVSTSISGLMTLKTELDAATTITAAHNDAEDIYTEYRVYALVAPKVDLIKVADDQQVVQAKLTSLAGKLQTRIASEQQAGKSVATLQGDLSDMNSQIAAASAISSNIESTVIGLQPTDYNSNHEVLSGDGTQLKTAHTDDQNALNDAKNIVTALKSM